MHNLKSTISLIIIGMSLGWMIGLSKSPVVSGVISTLLSFIISLLIALSGVETKENESIMKITKVKVSLFPIAVFIFFLSSFGTFGIYTRTHNWLGVESDIEKVGNNITEKSSEVKNEAGFMGIPSNACNEIYLNLDNYQSLKKYLKQLNTQQINDFLKTEPDSLSLVSFSKGICSNY